MISTLDRYQRLCDPSFPIFTLIAEICLSRNQSISLVTAGEGSWDLLVGESRNISIFV